MAIAKHICSQLNDPICKTLKVEPSVYSSFDTKIFDLTIYSPYSLALLAISVLCTYRMISHVDSLYSSIGRGEMKTTFTLYIIANTLLFIGLGFEKIFKGPYLDFINVLRSSFMSTTFFSLFAGGLTIDKIYGIMGMKSVNFMITLVSIYFTMIVIFVYVFVAVGIQELITVLTFIDIASIFMYIIVQIAKAKKKREDIWGIGTLGVTFLFFGMGVAHTFTAAPLVAAFSERNLDNLFFVILYNFLVVMMSHKYWLSTYDFEQECLALII